MEFTPGPWKTTNYGGESNCVVPGFAEDINGLYQSGHYICVCHDMLRGAGSVKANATLIAAAPDLLEACQYVVTWHREHDSGEGELFGLDLVTTCIGAIRKAVGEFTLDEIKKATT